MTNNTKLNEIKDFVGPSPFEIEAEDSEDILAYTVVVNGVYGPLFDVNLLEAVIALKKAAK